MKRKLLNLFIIIFIVVPAITHSQIITTIVTNIAGPTGLCSDQFGNIYIANSNSAQVLKMNTAGIVSVFAGDMYWAYSGDGGPATQASLNSPGGICSDSSGNIFIADMNNSRIRKVDVFGIITTVAGNGLTGYSGDGSIATTAKLNDPRAVCIDIYGNLFIADASNNRIRKIDSSGIISTVAGNGIAGFSGDNGLATMAELYYPSGLCTDTSGNLYIADTFNNRIRKIDTAGIISTFVGTTSGGYNGDGISAVSAKLNFPYGVYFDLSGNMFINDVGNNRIRRVNTAGIISTIAGIGVPGYSGDGGPSTLAELNGPYGGAFDLSGAMYISDYWNHVIRKITGPTDINETTETNNFSIYPNPSSDGNITLTFDMLLDGNVQVEIFTSDGKLIYSNSISCPANAHTELPVRLDELSAAGGIYILQARTSDAVIRKKLVVMRQN